MKKLLGILVILLLAAFAAAHEHEDEIAEGKALVDSKASCAELNDDQLEAIGEYVMEQMHPGEAHDQMHLMMGIKEDTPEHEQFHVHIARMMYCGQGMMGYGMMGGMMPMMRGGMMGGYGTQGGMMGSGMMGSTMWGFSSVLWTLILIGLVLVVWLWAFKLLRDVFGRR